MVRQTYTSIKLPNTLYSFVTIHGQFGTPAISVCYTNRMEAFISAWWRTPFRLCSERICALDQILPELFLGNRANPIAAHSLTNVIVCWKMLCTYNPACVAHWHSHRNEHGEQSTLQRKYFPSFSSAKHCNATSSVISQYIEYNSYRVIGSTSVTFPNQLLAYWANEWICFKLMWW